jgi:two-component system response regulator MprA
MACIRDAWRHDEPGTSSVKRILIVEDNSDLRSLLEDALDDAGYEVRAVGNGAEALELADRWRPDAIVLDLMMPVMDGPSFLRQRRDVPPLASIPVLVLTAHPFHHRVLDGLNATLLLRKPYDLDDLLGAVEALCAGQTGRGCVS